jgi:predicted nucleic acid-binding Zn ribbon protein
MNLEQKVKNWQAVEQWPKVVGQRIAQHAKAYAVDGYNLLVEVDTSMWQSQLFLMKSRIIKKYKEYDVHLKDIKFNIVKK